MRIFLTGASGFVGASVLRNLLGSGKHDLAILTHRPENAWRIKDLLPEVRQIKADFCNLKPIEVLLQEFQPQAFVHLAWQGVAGSERNNPAQWRNLPPTLELVEMASRVGAKHWIGLGSQAEYGPCQNKVDEAVLTKPTTLYGMTKLSSCLLSEKLCQELGLRHAWLRLFSAYGPTDNPDWLIPYLIKTLLAKQKPSLTAAEQLWDYIYVEDVASAITAILENHAATGIYNLGSGSAQSLRTVIEKIRDFIDPQLTLGFGEVAYRPDQVMHLEADISRLTAITGWSPMMDINTGLKQTIAWYASKNNNYEQS